MQNLKRKMLLCIFLSVWQHSWQSCHSFKKPIAVVTGWAWWSTPPKPSNKRGDGCVTNQGVRLERQETGNKRERESESWWYKQALHNSPRVDASSWVGSWEGMEEKVEAPLCHHVESVEQESESFTKWHLLCWTWLTAAWSAELPGSLMGIYWDTQYCLGEEKLRLTACSVYGEASLCSNCYQSYGFFWVWVRCIYNIFNLITVLTTLLRHGIIF